MNYEEFKQYQQDEFNKLPVKFAFGMNQFKEMMESWGLTVDDTDKIYRLGNIGGYYLKIDSPIIKAWVSRDWDGELRELMKDEEFAIDAFYYEMCNHEYGINWDGDEEVLACFGMSSLDELTENEAKCYRFARSKYNKDALEKGWY